ncbi:MAG: hypothetical protein PF447_13575 [Spirochaetaceae bacterium]|nr:hypothetical protein [Spirochaetaceae bacterium]
MFNWTASADSSIDSYYLYINRVSQSGGTTRVYGKTISADETNVISSSLYTGENYIAYLIAQKGYNSSEPIEISFLVPKKPNKPDILSIVDSPNETQVNIVTWTANCDYETNYYLHRKIEGVDTDYQEIAVLDAGTTSYRDSVEQGILYRYMLKSSNGVILSNEDYSNTFLTPMIIEDKFSWKPFIKPLGVDRI